MSNNFFRFKRFVVCQDRAAMKVGTDGVLLGGLVRMESGEEPRRILDIGTGTGLVALMLAQRYERAEVVGIDIDESAVGQARDNFEMSEFSSRLRAEIADVRDYDGGRFDMIVSNPPFFTSSLECPDDRRTMARHASQMPMEVLVEGIGRMLNEGGTAAVILPYDQAERIVEQMGRKGLVEKSRTTIYTTSRKPPKRVVSTFVWGKDGEVKTEYGQLTLLNGDGTRSDEYQEALKDYYL